MRPEDRLESIFPPPVRDYSKLAKRGEDPMMLMPAGPEFPLGVSVITLTLDEEVNLPRALESVSGSSDLVVLDSGSSDRTLDVAERCGARIFTRTFDTSAKQRQWALDHIDFRNQWVFVLDADEWVPRALAAELSQHLESADPGFVAAWLRSRYVFQGRWIPRSTLYPSWTMRLLKLGCVSYEPRAVNAHAVADGPTSRLQNDLIHEDRKPYLTRLRKLDRYARLEALECEQWATDPLKALLSASGSRRRAKIIHSLLPGRSLLKAAALMLRGAIVEGRPGLLFVEDSYFQERLTVRYRRELRQRELGDQ